jgi:ABC-type antimicrobial peptide transport system permease subunit
VAQTDGEARAPVAPVRAILRAADPEVPGRFSSLAERRGESLHDRQFIMSMLTGFAAFGLLLAAVGVYGVLAYTTALRTREFGIRLALGSRRREVMTLVVRRAAAPVLVGVIGGLLGAYALAGLLESMVFGLDPHQPGVFVVVVPVLMAAAAVACVVPARRAVRVDPIITLRSE